MFVIVLWGANFTVQKSLFDVIGPNGFLFARYAIMPICAILLLLQRFGFDLPRVTRNDFRALLKLGLAGHLLHVGIVAQGIHLSTAFSSSLILACGPICTLIILRWMGVERLNRAQVTGVVIACAGVLVFLSEKLLSGRLQATGGDLMLLVAAALFSYYTVAAKPMIERYGTVVVMAYATILGCVPGVLLTLPAGLAVTWSVLPAAFWIGLLWAIVVSSFVGWLAWGWVNAVRGVARTAPLNYLMPPVAGFVAWFGTGEHFTTVKMIGAAVTLAGVAVAQFSGWAAREVPAQVE